MVGLYTALTVTPKVPASVGLVGVGSWSRLGLQLPERTPLQKTATPRAKPLRRCSAKSLCSCRPCRTLTGQEVCTGVSEQGVCVHRSEAGHAQWLIGMQECPFKGAKLADAYVPHLSCGETLCTVACFKGSGLVNSCASCHACL